MFPQPSRESVIVFPNPPRESVILSFHQFGRSVIVFPQPSRESVILDVPKVRDTCRICGLVSVTLQNQVAVRCRE
jgi:hypothetical protein